MLRLKLCLAAVQQNGDALQYVQNQTPEICLAAVKENGNALLYVQTQTPEICLEAVKQTKKAYAYVQPQICIFDDTPFRSYYVEQECSIPCTSLEDRRSAFQALHLLNKYLPDLSDECMRHICLRIS